MGEVAEMFDVKTSLIRHWETQFSILQPKRNKKGNRLFSPEDVENLKVIYHLVKERGMTLEGAKRAMKRRAAGGAGEIRREAELMTRLRHIRALLVEVREDLKTGGEGIVDDEKEAAEAPAPEAPAPRRRKQAVVKLAPEEPAAAEAPRSAEPEQAEEEPFAAPLPKEEPAFAEPQPAEEIPVQAEAPGWDEEAPIPEAEPAEPEMPAVEAEPSIPEEEPEAEELPEDAEEAEPEEPETLAAEEEARAKKPEPEGGDPKPRGRRGRRKADDENQELFAFYEQSLF